MPIIKRESTNQRTINVQVNKYWIKVWYDEPNGEHDSWWDMHIPKELIEEWNQGEVHRVYKEYMPSYYQIKTFDDLKEDDVFHLVNYFAYTRPHKEWRKENMLEDIKSYNRQYEVRKAAYINDEDIVIREFNSYIEMKQAQQEDVNNFPVCWLFGQLSEKECKDELEKKLGSRNLKNYCYGIAGEILRKSDARAYARMWFIHDKERQKFVEDFDHLVSMIRYEMDNHEYGYTQDKYDTLLALGKGFDDLTKDVQFAEAWKKAEKECFESYEECNS